MCLPSTKLASKPGFGAGREQDKMCIPSADPKILRTAHGQLACDLAPARGLETGTTTLLGLISEDAREPRPVARAPAGLGRMAAPDVACGVWAPGEHTGSASSKTTSVSSSIRRPSGPDSYPQGKPPTFPSSFPVPQTHILVLGENCPPRRTVKAGSCQVALFGSLFSSYAVPGLQHARGNRASCSLP